MYEEVFLTLDDLKRVLLAALSWELYVLVFCSLQINLLKFLVFYVNIYGKHKYFTSSAKIKRLIDQGN